MSLSDIPANIINNDIASNFDKIVGKLTLFSENVGKKIKPDEILVLERPVTPIEQEIKDSPTSLPELIFLLQRRIPLHKETILSEESQLCLLGIMEKEITLLWPELKSLLNYPLFNNNQNQELRSTIFIEIISQCKATFDEYVEKMHLFNNRDIFSEESNLVRIKLQLASDVRHKLHIPTLRRHVYQNISRDIHVDIPQCCPMPSLEKTEKDFQLMVLDKKLPNVGDLKKSQIPKESIAVQSIVTETRQNIDNIVPVISENEKKTSSSEIFKSKVFLKNDLVALATDDKVDEINDEDSFPKMSFAMPSVKDNELRNECLQNKIETLTTQNSQKQKLEEYVFHQPLVKQPCSIPKFFNNQIYLIPDIRPTERKSQYDISLADHGPVWNELADEITPDVIFKLDSNLFRGEEVKDIYKEMMSTVSRDYLSFSDDPLIEDCPSRVYIQDIQSSRTLINESRKERIINPQLKIFHDSPWNQLMKTRSEWEQPNYALDNSSSTDLNLKQYVDMSINELSRGIVFSRGSRTISPTKDINIESKLDKKSTFPRSIFPKRDYILSLENFVKGTSKLSKLMQDRVVKQYKEWLDNWRNNFSTEDYMKYQSLQPSDFLSVIFHDYDSCGEYCSEDDEDLYPELVEEKNRMLQREQERLDIMENKIEELQNEKNHYEKGLWNPSIIFIGGLGKDPALTVDEKRELLKDKPSLPDPRERKAKRSAYSRARSAVSAGKPEPLFTKKKNEHASSEYRISDDDRFNALQDRLEKIWEQLKMPNHLRLDMAIKYSSGFDMKTIENVLQIWEEATNVLLEREKLIEELEKFERIASNPNRFFVKGYQGSSLARAEESKIRLDLNEKIEKVSINVTKAIQHLKISCSDQLTYEGRPYDDKLSWDRTEMLYWLQEERKERSTNWIFDSLAIKSSIE